jgi:hypothetical protein
MLDVIFPGGQKLQFSFGQLSLQLAHTKAEGDKIYLKKTTTFTKKAFKHKKGKK